MVWKMNLSPTSIQNQLWEIWLLKLQWNSSAQSTFSKSIFDKNKLSSVTNLTISTTPEKFSGHSEDWTTPFMIQDIWKLLGFQNWLCKSLKYTGNFGFHCLMKKNLLISFATRSSSFSPFKIWKERANSHPNMMMFHPRQILCL